MAAESSLLLAATSEKISKAATPAATPDIGGIVEEKMGIIQNNTMKEIEEKLDDKLASFLTVVQQMFSYIESEYPLSMAIFSYYFQEEETKCQLFGRSFRLQFLPSAKQH